MDKQQIIIASELLGGLIALVSTIVLIKIAPIAVGFLVVGSVVVIIGEYLRRQK